MKLKDRLIKFAITHSDRLSQAINKPVIGEPFVNEDMFDVCRRAAGEGIVLLKNNGVLPLRKQEEVAFFGRVQHDYFYVGYGSGGDVRAPYRISPLDAITARDDIRYNRALAQTYRTWCKENAPFEGVWGMWPTCFEEMPLSLETVVGAAQTSRKAVIFLGRAMGESMDNKLKKGCYYLSDPERQLLDTVTSVFSDVVVVIDAGNIIDLHWTKEYGSRIGAIVYAFQGGMEAGHAVVDVLYGDSNPCGKLTDTIALRYRDYPTSQNFGKAAYNCYEEDIYVGYRYFETFLPNKVLYPFGFGLSYTTFRLDTVYAEAESRCLLDVTVTNTGSRAGKEVVQIYINPPQGLLGKPVRNLIAFQKTRLLAPGECQTLSFDIDPKQFASYDDSGITGNPYCYVLEAGDYDIYVGTDVRHAEKQATWRCGELQVAQQLSSQAGAAAEFARMKPAAGENGKIELTFEPVPLGAADLKADIEENIPAAVPMVGDAGIRFDDVRSGSASLDDFVAQLHIKDLDAITRGEGKMESPLGIEGNAGALGGVTEHLRKLGIPPIITTDGPAGIRIRHYASLLPCGTALACTWNTALIEELGGFFGREMAQTGADILLGPGMNIHRDPLCGRNFEYFSEDPHVSGKIAAAMVRGIQSVSGRSACPKHFACNNQEWMRSRNDSRLSERALREIYLKGFEICVKESAPKTLMTSYNKINGVWGHYHYALVTNILRKEWGFGGLVITDWWMQPSRDPNFPALRNDAYRVRAQVDVLMPGGQNHVNGQGDGSLEESYLASGGITLGELQRCAKNVLRLCLDLKK
jgi:beta-glucosidase